MPDENDWDESSPALTDPRRDGAEEIRAVRSSVRNRLEKEHVTPAGSGVGGEHKEGSAKGYYEASAPTQRPDGATNLDSDDAGRLWIDSDNGQVHYWSGSAWVPFAGVVLEGSALAYYEASAPTTRPDGTTNLNSADAGRLWMDSDDKRFWVYNGTAWEKTGIGEVTQNGTSLAAEFFSSGGWTNNTGYQAFLHWEFSVTGGGNALLQVDYGSGFETVLNLQLDTTDRKNGLVVVPPGGVARMTNTTFTNTEAAVQRV